MERLDAIVVGTGPAGLAAAVNLAIRGKSFRLFGTPRLSDKIQLAPRVDNYLGLPGISGKELADKLTGHLREIGIDITHQQVSSIYDMGGYFAAATGTAVYEATAVVIAAGVLTDKPIPGEQRLLGRGLSYCATCDAPLYKGKTVAVIGYTEEAVTEANFLSGIAAKVYYIPAKPIMGTLSPAVQAVEGKVREVTGEDAVSAVVLEDKSLAIDGIFIIRDSVAPSALIPGIELRDGFIAVDSEMRTNLPGCFAAGDCTGKPHQYMRAAGQGQVAGLNAAAYVDAHSNKK